MTDVEISVVVATRDRAAMLQRLLSALAIQEPPSGGFEVIVVDDGSRDRTPEVVAVAGVRSHRLAGCGPAIARNVGWRAAHGHVVVFTDDDCVPEPSWLVTLTKPFRDDHALDGVGGTVAPLAHGFFEDFAHGEHLADHGIGADGDVRYLVTANAAFRRSALLRIGGFDETFPEPAGEDVDLSVRLLESDGRLRVIGEAEVRHDYRVGIRSLLITAGRHGRARARLAQRHPELRVGAAPGRPTAASRWLRRATRDRTEYGWIRACAYLGLRLAFLATFATAFVTQARRS